MDSEMNKPPIACTKDCKRGECHDFIPEANCYVFWCEVTKTGGIMSLDDNPSWKMISPISRDDWVKMLANGIDSIYTTIGAVVKH